MRPLTFTSPAFQSAVSIKDGCSSYVFPIHQRRRDTRPGDGQLRLMEGGRADSETERARKTEELETVSVGQKKNVWSPNKTVKRRRVSEKELKQHLDPECVQLGGLGAAAGTV